MRPGPAGACLWGRMVGKEKQVLQLQALAALGSGQGLLGCWPFEPGPLGLPGQAQYIELCLPFLSSAHQPLCLHFMGPYSTCPGSQHPYLAGVFRLGQKAA